MGVETSESAAQAEANAADMKENSQKVGSHRTALLLTGVVILLAALGIAGAFIYKRKRAADRLAKDTEKSEDNMKKNQGMIRRGLALLLALVLLTGCGAAADNQMPQITSAVADAMEESSAAESATASEVVALQEENEIPTDGVITKAQMETVAGQDMTVHFNGETAEGITYTWSYEAKQIQNPTEQKLLVQVSADGLEDIKKEAADAPYALAVTLQDMELAAAPTLTLTLQEKWEADTAFYCCEDNGLKKLSDAEITAVQGSNGEVSRITFTVPKAGGTFYLVAGSSKAAETADTAQESETAEASADITADTSSGSQNTATDKKQTGDAKTETTAKTEEKQEKLPTCTISIECKTILDNLDQLRSSKADYVPADGWILYKSTVEFEKGNTVFDVLKKVTKAAGIQMESKWTPMYNSYYIEGINQLYEFDCGEQSGWMYSVNGWFPNYGCSSYELKDGDKIEWRYTCDLGSDVGNAYTGD